MLRALIFENTGGVCPMDPSRGGQFTVHRKFMAWWREYIPRATCLPYGGYMGAYLHRSVVMADGRKLKLDVQVAKMLKLLPQHLRTAENMLDISQKVL